MLEVGLRSEVFSAKYPSELWGHSNELIEDVPEEEWALYDLKQVGCQNGRLASPMRTNLGGETGQGQALPVHVVGFALIEWFAGGLVVGRMGGWRHSRTLTS